MWPSGTWLLPCSTSLSKFICVVTCIRTSSPFNGRIIFHYMDILHSLYTWISWWIFELLFLLFGYCEWCHCEHWFTSFCVDIGFLGTYSCFVSSWAFQCQDHLKSVCVSGTIRGEEDSPEVRRICPGEFYKAVPRTGGMWGRCFELGMSEWTHRHSCAVWPFGRWVCLICRGRAMLTTESICRN